MDKLWTNCGQTVFCPQFVQHYNCGIGGKEVEELGDNEEEELGNGMIVVLLGALAVMLTT